MRWTRVCRLLFQNFLYRCAPPGSMGMSTRSCQLAECQQSANWCSASSHSQIYHTRVSPSTSPSKKSANPWRQYAGTIGANDSLRRAGGFAPNSSGHRQRIRARPRPGTRSFFSFVASLCVDKNSLVLRSGEIFCASLPPGPRSLARTTGGEPRAMIPVYRKPRPTLVDPVSWMRGQMIANERCSRL